MTKPPLIAVSPDGQATSTQSVAGPLHQSVDMTGGICAVGEHGEIRRLQRLTRIRLNEQLIGLSPVAVRGSAMRTFQERGLSHLIHCRLRGRERQ